MPAITQRQIRRQSPEAARNLIEHFYPDKTARFAVLELFASAIERAAKLGQARWGVTLRSRHVRLNVGRLLVFGLQPSVVFVSLDPKALEPAAVEFLRSVAQPSEGYRVLPVLTNHAIPAEHFPEARSLIERALLSAVDLAADTARQTPWARSHSPGVIGYLADAVRRSMPSPVYAAGAEPEAEEEPGGDEPQVYWVNQGKTFERERAAGIVMAGKQDSAGRTLGHRDRVGELEPGDVLVHYSAAAIRAVSRVVADAEEALEEATGRAAGAWVARVEYFNLREPVALSQPLAAAIQALPLEDGPLNRDGGVKEGYLWRFSSAGVRLLQDAVAQTWPEWVAEVAERRRRAVKIAPGAGARFWEDCRREGYICVGWDEVGDLRGYPTFDAFRAAFAEKTEERGKAKGHITRKARELWTLIELQPGDLVVTNRGNSQVLAVGTVVAPGYSYRPDRAEHRHTVAVEWDESYATAIPPVGSWGTTTVEPISEELLARIMDRPAPDLFQALSQKGLHFPDELVAAYLLALQTKRFVILTGISGTGKTQLALAVARHYQARRRTDRAGLPPEGAHRIQVRPYMRKYRRMVLPAALSSELSRLITSLLGRASPSRG